MSYLQMYSTGVCYVLFRWDTAWGNKTVLVSGCFCSQWSVALARGQQFKERVSWMWGVQSNFLSPFPHSGGVKFLEVGQRGTDNPLSSPNCPFFTKHLICLACGFVCIDIYIYIKHISIYSHLNVAVCSDILRVMFFKGGVLNVYEIAHWGKWQC